jgi:hypothetical protein
MERYTVIEAAQILGVGPDAIRKRIKRGTIQYERIDDTLYVWLDESETRRAGGDTAALLEAYRQQVEWLRREVERKDTLLMSLMQRIPELEPASVSDSSSDASDSTVTVSEQESKGQAPPDQETAKSEPWWRRIFR